MASNPSRSAGGLVMGEGQVSSKAALPSLASRVAAESAPEPPTQSVKSGAGPVVVPVELPASPELDNEPVVPPVEVLLPPVAPEPGPGPVLEGPPPPLEVAAEVPVVPAKEDADVVPVAEPREGE